MSAVTTRLKKLYRSQRRRCVAEHQSIAPSSNSGLTLLECLMAVAILGLTVTMIAPPLLVATVSRVQQRRAEQAFQLAQGEVDRVQVLVARARHTANRLPATASVPNNPPPTTATLNSAVAVPNTIANVLDTVNSGCTGVTLYHEEQLPVNTVRPIDIDGDCKADFYLQSFRTPGTVSTAEINAGTNRPSQFIVGVRVYSFQAKDSLDRGVALLKEPITLNMSSDISRQRRQPLSVIYSNLRWTERSDTACDYFTNNGNCP